MAVHEHDRDESIRVLESLEASLEQMLIGKLPAPIEQVSQSAQMNRIIELVNMLSGNFAEAHRFASDLSKGILDGEIPGRRNYLAAPLKQLHAQMSGFTWVIGQLISGHKAAVPAYMGEISIAMEKLIGWASKQEEPSDRKEAMRAENRQHRRLKALVDHLPHMVLAADGEGQILFANQGAYRGMGGMGRLADGEDILHKTLVIHNNQTNSFPFYSEIWDEDLDIWYKVITDILPGESITYLHMIEDISQWKHNERMLRRTSNLDPLTGIANRAVGMKALETALADQKLHTSCLVFIDVDGLKTVNDSYGHNEGDYVIATIAGAFASSLRGRDTVSRFGGDEFLLVLGDCAIQRAEQIIGRVQEKIHGINQAGKKPYPLGFSYGIAQIDRETSLTAEQIIHLADKKMYERKRAKRAGNG